MGNPVISWQILAKDTERIERFYSELFDWRANRDNPLGCAMVETGSERGIDGGIWPAPPEAPSFVQLHVEVDDVDGYLERATALGANVIVPAQTLPAGERMAVLHDPEGVPFVLVQPAS